jgi:hypothetical protein
MKILYNVAINEWKQLSSELRFAYCFATFAASMLVWHIVDKIIAFTVVADELKLIFT